MALSKTQEVNMTFAHMSVETESGDSLFVCFAFDADTPGAKNTAGALALERLEEDLVENRWVAAYCLSKGADLHVLEQLPPNLQTILMQEKGFSKEGTYRTRRETKRAIEDQMV